jgi:hypothetical protein
MVTTRPVSRVAAPFNIADPPIPHGDSLLAQSTIIDENAARGPNIDAVTSISREN